MPAEGPVGRFSVAARAPAALLPVGMLAAVGGNGSLVAAAMTTSFALIGLGLSVPVSGAAAERFGQRSVLLTTAASHVMFLVLILAAVPRLNTGVAPSGSTPALLVAMGLFAFGAGLTAPPVSSFSRSRGWFLHSCRPEFGVGAARRMRTEAFTDELLLILAPLTVGVLAGMIGTGAGLVVSALLATLAVPAYAMSPLALQMEQRLLVDDDADPGDGPWEPLRVPLVPVEHGQQMVAEARGLLPESPGAPVRSVGPTSGPVSSSMGAVLISCLGVGLVFGGVWTTAVVSAAQMHRPAAFALVLALAAGAAAVSSRWLPPRLSGLDVPRRRRLFAVLLAVGTMLLLAVRSLVGEGFVGFAMSGALIIVVGVCAGVILVEVYRSLAERAPTATLVSALSTVAGVLLVGLVMGLTCAALFAESVGAGWEAGVCVVGALLPAAVALRPGPIPVRLR